MGSKITLSIAALAIGTALATVSAFAQEQPSRSNNPGDQYMRSDAAPDYAPSQNYDYYQGQAPMAQDTAWCAAHFQTYNPSTGQYHGYDGAMHTCP